MATAIRGPEVHGLATPPARAASRRYARYGAAAGIVWAVLLLLALFVIPDPPAVKSAPSAWARYFVDHRSGVQVGNALIAVGVFFYVWFLASLHSGLRAAEGGTGRLSNVAFGAGIASIGFILIAVTVAFAAALRPAETSPDVLRTLNDVGVVAGGASVGTYAALLVATAVAALRFGALSRRVGWTAAVCGVLQFLAVGEAVTVSGAFALDELGGAVPLIAFIVAIVAISIGLIRAPAE